MKRDRLKSIGRPLFIPEGDGIGFRLSNSQDLHFTFEMASQIQEASDNFNCPRGPSLTICIKVESLISRLL